MNLNNMGTGRKLIDKILDQGRVKGLGPLAQKARIDQQPNPYSVKSRPKQ